MEVDHAANPTRLYESIQSSDWTSAARAIRLYPDEASTWVVRHDDSADGGFLWRFLPLHSALARNPPASFVEALIQAHPSALGEKDVSGMLPIHYATGNRCSKDIMEMLVGGDATSVWEVDGNGMSPLHYVGAYGCDDGVVELMLSAAKETGDVKALIGMKDSGGMTPIKLAKEGDYEGNEAVVNALQRALNGHLDIGRDNRAGLQVVTQSPRSHAIPRSARKSPRSSRSAGGRVILSEDEMVNDDIKDKHFHGVISPRNSSSGEYPIHMMDSRSPLPTNNDNDARNDIPARRTYSITTRSLESPLHASTNSNTPTMSNTNLGYESPNAFNMKTPRSSGHGKRFGFDHPPPSPRYPQSMTSPRALLSPRARQSPVPPPHTSDMMSELQRLRAENESLQQQVQQNAQPDLRMLQMQNETLMLQSQQRDAENAELRAQLEEYQKCPTYNTISAQQVVEATGARLQALLTSLQQREQALTSIIQMAEQRENSRLQSYTTRKQEILKLLAAEENERQKENGFIHEGNTIGMAFGRELKGLQDARCEVARMLEALSTN